MGKAKPTGNGRGMQGAEIISQRDIRAFTWVKQTEEEQSNAKDRVETTPWREHV